MVGWGLLGGSWGIYNVKVGGRHGEVRWASSGFKEEGSSEKCPATAGNRAGRDGFNRKREWCVVG